MFSIFHHLRHGFAHHHGYILQYEGQVQGIGCYDSSSSCVDTIYFDKLVLSWNEMMSRRGTLHLVVIIERRFINFLQCLESLKVKEIKDLILF